MLLFSPKKVVLCAGLIFCGFCHKMDSKSLDFALGTSIICEPRPSGCKVTRLAINSDFQLPLMDLHVTKFCLFHMESETIIGYTFLISNGIC